MSGAHTLGPWRWEFNRDGKSMHLVGGRPRYDLTIMDFVRWGMQGGGVRMRDTTQDGLQLMFEVHKRPDWVAPFPGREHHANWCADVVHPDMRLIATSPELLAEIEREYITLADYEHDWPGRHSAEGQAKLIRLRDLIAKATGREPRDVQDDYGTRAARARATS